MAKICFTVGVAVCGPIEAKTYQVRCKSIAVSYPDRLIVHGAPQMPAQVTPLPLGRSTQFVVEWDDVGAFAAALQSTGFERHLVVHEALDAISELLLAFKLVRIGHLDGRGLRTVGIGDTLYFFSTVDGVATGDLNVSLRQPGGRDSFETTDLAGPHVGMDTVPLARRYVRCFELIEHGFYTEAFLVAFALLDDFVNQTLTGLLERRGLTSNTDRQALMRGIKEQRLTLYLGPLLKLASGADIQTLWPGASSALQWFNSTRNRIAHAAETVDRSSATWAIFASLKVVICLRQAGLVSPAQAASADIPVELFREAKLMAAWAFNPPAWVPRGPLAESMDFES